MQRSILISYLAAYFSSRYNLSSPGNLSAASIVMASAGQATAHRPQAVQFSRPSASRFNTCKPRNTGEKGRFSSGYCIVAFFRNICFKVMAIPLIIFHRYRLSRKVMGLRSTGFARCVSCIVSYTFQFMI